MVDYEPGRSGRAAAVEAAAGDVRGPIVDRADVQAGLLRRRERVADCRDLRLGKDHARRTGAVVADLHVLAEDPVGGDPALVLAHVRQEIAAVHVADRIQPLVLGRLQRLADLDRLPRLEADRLDPELRGPRAAADGDEQLVASQAVARLELEPHLPVPRRGDGLDADAHVDPAIDERGVDELCGERLLPAEQPRHCLDDGNTRPERCPRLRELHARDAAAEHEQPAGDLLRGRRLAVRPRLRLAEPGDRRHGRLAPGRDDDSRPCLEHLVSDQEATLAVEPGRAADERHAALVEPRQLRAVVEVVDHFVAPLERRLHVQLPRDGLARARDPPRLVERLGRPQQGLRGHARVVGAFAADEVLLDERDLEPAFAESAGACLARRTRADHDGVECPRCHDIPPRSTRQLLA